MTEQVPTYRAGETGHTDYSELTATETEEAGDVSVTPPADSGSAASDASMKEKATESAQAGRDAAGEVATTAGDKAKDVAAETKQQAANVWSTAQGQLREQAGTQHRNAVDTLRSLGDELASMAEHGSGSGTAAHFAHQAADRSQRAASWLDAREPGQLVDELRAFAGRRPGAFLLGALAAGVAAGRLTRGVTAAHSEGEEQASPDGVTGP